MPRFDDRYSDTRLYVGRLSSRTRSRDLDSLFGRYGRVRDVDMKHDYAFVEFSDPRDADDARHRLNGREVDGSRIIVEFAKGTPRGSREYLGKGPPPGSGRCFNCGIDGHWARDCKAGDWKNTCYRCGERGHIERNCQNSPKKLRRGRSYSRSPVRSRSPRRGRSHSYSRSRSPPRRGRIIGREAKPSKSYSRSPETKRVASPLAKQRSYSPTPEEDRSRSYSRSPEPKRGDSPPVKSRSYSPTPEEDPSRSYSRSPELKRGASPLAKSRSYSPTPEEDIMSEGDSPPPKRGRAAAEQDKSEYNENPSRSYGRSPEPKRCASPPADRRSYSPTPEDDIIREGDSPPKSGRLATEQDRSEYNEDARANSRSPDGYSHGAGGYRSPSEVNGYSHSPSPPDYRSRDVDDDDNDDNHRFRRE